MAHSCNSSDATPGLLSLLKGDHRVVIDYCIDAIPMGAISSNPSLILVLATTIGATSTVSSAPISSAGAPPSILKHWWLTVPLGPSVVYDTRNASHEAVISNTI